MKFSVLFIACANLASAQNIKLSEGGLYSVPYVSKEKIFLKLDYTTEDLILPRTVDGLDMNCNRIKSYVAKNPLNNAITKKSYDGLRRLAFPNEISYTSFAVRFKIDAQSSLDLVKRNISLANSTVTQSNSGQVKLQDSKTILDNFNFSVRSISEDSLTNVSIKAGFAPIPVEVMRYTSYPNYEVSTNRSVSAPINPLSEDNDNVYVYIRGRDTFCDLMAGKAVLEINSVVSLEADAQDLSEISQFYNSTIPPVVEKIFKSKSSIVGRAALVGYKFGEILKKFSNNSEEDSTIVPQIESLVDLLFDPITFERSGSWTQVGGVKKIQIPSIQDAPATYSFEVIK
ncbi:MAG: hypothetical protein QE271_04915 [Bacteriovoracaceae bacterium]|nr:hypothetical protein [Bacteriovoracaceae bacterium]